MSGPRLVINNPRPLPAATSVPTSVPISLVQAVIDRRAKLIRDATAANTTLIDAVEFMARAARGLVLANLELVAELANSTEVSDEEPAEGEAPPDGVA